MKFADFTKYTKQGVDNENHFGEHYCCLINALIQLGCDGSVLLEARTCITGLFVPKSALKEFCDIARIKIKLYWYENDTKQGKKLKNANMWDKTNECLKDAPVSAPPHSRLEKNDIQTFVVTRFCASTLPANRCL